MIKCGYCGRKLKENKTGLATDLLNYASDLFTEDPAYIGLIEDIHTEIKLNKVWDEVFWIFTGYSPPEYSDIKDILDTYINIQLNDDNKKYPVYDNQYFKLNEDEDKYIISDEKQKLLVETVTTQSTRPILLVNRVLELLHQFTKDETVKTTKFLDPRTAKKYEKNRETPEILKGGIFGNLGLTKNNMLIALTVAGIGASLYALGKGTEIYKVIKG